MKPYFSLDIETTGTESDIDNILEVAIVFDPNTEKPIEECPKLHFFVKHKIYTSTSAYAILMNKRYFENASKNERGKETEAIFIERREICDRIANFINEHNPEGEPIRFTGKNFASFDLLFLKANGLYHSIEKKKIDYRYLDIGSYYFDSNNMDWIPSSSECYKIAGLNKSVAHSAIEDAYDAIRLIRFKVDKEKPF